MHSSLAPESCLRDEKKISIVAQELVVWRSLCLLLLLFLHICFTVRSLDLGPEEFIALCVCVSMYHTRTHKC